MNVKISYYVCIQYAILNFVKIFSGMPAKRQKNFLIFFIYLEGVSEGVCK